MEKKITKLMVVEMMLADKVIAGNDTYKKFLENERDLLQRKSENRKATSRQTENVEIKETIIEVMSSMTPSTATEIMNAVKNTDMDKYGTLTNQRVSALLRQLIDEGQVVKTIEKKVSRFVLL